VGWWVVQPLLPLNPLFYPSMMLFEFGHLQTAAPQFTTATDPEVAVLAAGRFGRTALP